jgi:hypothetical protein
MTLLLQLIQSLFAVPQAQRDIDEAYLAQSVDIHELERRMREIDQRGRSENHAVMLGLYVR